MFGYSSCEFYPCLRVNSMGRRERWCSAWGGSVGLGMEEEEESWVERIEREGQEK